MSQDVLWLIVCRTYPVNITILFDNIDLILLFYNSILSLNRLNSRSYESVMVSLVLINSVFLSCDSTMILAEKARGQHHAVCVYYRLIIYSFFYNLALIIDYPVFLGHFQYNCSFIYITETILMQSFFCPILNTGPKCFTKVRSPKFDETETKLEAAYFGTKT